MKNKSIPIYLLLFSTSSLASESTITPEQATLDEVVVITELEKFKATNKLKSDVNLSLLGKQQAFTSPITVVNYEETAITDQSPRNLVDAVAKIDPSAMNFGGETNTLSGIYVRNLQLDARQFSVNGLAGLYSTYNSPMAAVSSAQLIKGASTATTGMDPEGSSGASLNIETKRATDKDINKIGFAWYSNNRLQESFDVGRRFGLNKEWGIRINGLYRDGNTARTHYDERNKEFAISTDYRGERFRIGFDYMFSKRATHGGRGRVQDIQNLTYQLPSPPNGKVNLSPYWSGQTTEDETILTTFEYDLTTNLMLSGGIGQMYSQYYGAFGQILATDLKENGDYKIRQMRAIDYRTRTTSMNLKLQGEYLTDTISHNWNLAFDNVSRRRNFKQSETLATFSAGNIYQPTFSLNNPTFPELVPASTNIKLHSYSLAFADTLGLFDNQLRLTLGGRYQWIKQINYYKDGLKADKSTLSPLLTIAWVPNADLMVYGNYLEDLEPGSVDDDGHMASPIISRQYEVGMRKNWGENITTTLSAYQISRPGTITPKAASKYSRIAGEQQGTERNRGIEFNIYTNVFNNTLRTNFGITYNQAKLINYASYAGEIINSTQVASPRIIAKAAIEWDPTFIPNLTLNSALQYYGKSYQDYAKKYEFPAYSTVDIGAKYVWQIKSTENLTFRIGVENLFNKHYWQVQRGRYDRSFAVIGMPRTYWAKIEYTF
ncbi:TonB-dependent siderophore receptor [Gallibacterium trehalosifermentans]|uniref:TonB-dependent siderophore receptor n=1 Tax=Gallibacterium trehalosifermentans TaxID=516935 RepID=A0ABV6GZV2_9PAST